MPTKNELLNVIKNHPNYHMIKKQSKKNIIEIFKTYNYDRIQEEKLEKDSNCTNEKIFKYINP